MARFRLVHALALVACLPCAAAADIVARVNGTPISRKAVDDVVDGTLALQRNAATDRRRLEAAALASLIDLELLYQASAARGLLATDAEVDSEIAHNRSQFPDDKSFADALAGKGMTTGDLRHDTRKMLSANKYLERVVWRDVEVSTEEVARFYQARRDQFRRPEEVRASHILLRLSPGASEDTRRKQYARAEAIVAELRAGADFADLARRHSEDQATAKQGGDLGFFQRGTMVDEFEKPVFSLMPGQITPIFETPYGFHIAKVTDRRLQSIRPLDEVRDVIRSLLVEQERQRLQAAHLEKLRRQATIEILDPALAPGN